jgi:hypothetical protein
MSAAQTIAAAAVELEKLVGFKPIARVVCWSHCERFVCALANGEKRWFQVSGSERGGFVCTIDGVEHHIPH